MESQYPDINDLRHASSPHILPVLPPAPLDTDFLSSFSFLYSDETYKGICAKTASAFSSIFTDSVTGQIHVRNENHPFFLPDPAPSPAGLFYQCLPHLQAPSPVPAGTGILSAPADTSADCHCLIDFKVNLLPPPALLLLLPWQDARYGCAVQRSCQSRNHPDHEVPLLCHP